MNAILDKLKGWGEANAYSTSDKAEIEKLYMDVLDKVFVRTSCNDCYRDAVYEMYSYLKKNGKMKEKSIYKLKNGVLLQMGFGSGEFYTNANLTDEIAEKYLEEHPERINYFAIYPDDWQDRAKIDKPKRKFKRKKE